MCIHISTCNVGIKLIMFHYFYCYLYFRPKIKLFVYCIYTSVDTEMCCPKGKCGCQYFILLTLKKPTNPGLLFLLKVRSCVFISNFHHSPPPPPKGYKIVSLIIN